jgi:hypothetical protein
MISRHPDAFLVSRTWWRPTTIASFSPTFVGRMFTLHRRSGRHPSYRRDWGAARVAGLRDVLRLRQQQLANLTAQDSADHVEVVEHHLDTHDSPFLFPNETGGFFWRHSWRTRTFNPAFDGNLDLTAPAVRTYPVRPGLTFHELRHSHKTWLIAAGIPEVAQARRLGHRMDKRTQARLVECAPRHRPAPSRTAGDSPQRTHPTTPHDITGRRAPQVPSRAIPLRRLRTRALTSTNDGHDRLTPRSNREHNAPHSPHI